MIKINKITELIAIIFIMAIPLQPIFRLEGFYFLALIVCIFGTIFALKNKRMFLFKFEKMQFLFILLMFASLIIGSNQFERFKYVFGIVRYIIFVLFAIRLFLNAVPKNTENKAIYVARKILNSFMVATIIISIYIVINEPSVNGFYGRMGRYIYAGDYGGYIVYSYNLIISSLWAIFCFINEKIKKNKFLYFVSLLVLIPCSLLNGTKKILIAIALFLIGYILLNDKKAIKKFSYIIICFFALFVVYKQITTNDYLNLLIGNRITSFINSFSNDSSAYVDESTIQRSLMRKEASRYFLENPLFGIGISSFMYRFGDEYGFYLYSHNNYLEILSGLGIIGFIVYYGWFIKAIINLQKKSSKDNKIWFFFFLFMIVTLILDYGTVSFDKIHYILMFNMISMYNYYCNENRKYGDIYGK